MDFFLSLLDFSINTALNVLPKKVVCIFIYIYLLGRSLGVYTLFTFVHGRKKRLNVYVQIDSNDFEIYINGDLYISNYVRRKLNARLYDISKLLTDLPRKNYI